MSKLAELAYDIEQMYIEGYSPKTIAALLECDLSVVYDWLEDVGMGGDEIEPEEWDAAFPESTFDNWVDAVDADN